MSSRSLAVRQLGASLSGGALPALVGIAATVIANRLGASDILVALLVAWTINGYLSLSDFGLTRATSMIVSHGADPHDAIHRLRRPALLVGAGLTAALAAALALHSVWASGVLASALWVMVPIPLITCHQFPLIGALEASGRFGVVAVHKVLSAVSTYLVPALLLGAGHRGLLVGLVVLVGYRLVAVVGLRALLPAARGGATRSGADATGGASPADEISAWGVITWVGASSLLGPLFLYIDRGFVAIGSAPVSLLIFYTSLSEILLRTYIVPTSLLSVVFPMTVRMLRDRPDRVHRAFGFQLPALTVLGVVLALVASWVAPAGVLSGLGVMPADLGTARLVLAILATGTVVNWASQGQIALVQALGRQRSVVVAQAALLVPYLGAMAAAATVGVVAVAAVWLLRIVVLGGILWRLGAVGAAARSQVRSLLVS